jgi:hypothetical protein
MPSYTFRYVDGQSAPYQTIEASNDFRARRKIKRFLSQKPGATLIRSSLTVRFPLPKPSLPLIPPEFADESLNSN